MAEPKRSFPTPQHGIAGEGNPDFRSAAALEFIAYYLDRIDGHLEQLASLSQGTGEAVGRISADLRGIAHLIANKK